MYHGYRECFFVGIRDHARRSKKAVPVPNTVESTQHERRIAWAALRTALRAVLRWLCLMFSEREVTIKREQREEENKREEKGEENKIMEEKDGSRDDVGKKSKKVRRRYES